MTPDEPGSLPTYLDLSEVDRHVAEFKDFLNRLYGDYGEFGQALAADVRIAAENCATQDNQFHRRTFLRTFFARTYAN